MNTSLRIGGDRLCGTLRELAQIGATEKGGVFRLAFTDLDRRARDLATSLLFVFSARSN